MWRDWYFSLSVLIYLNTGSERISSLHEMIVYIIDINKILPKACFPTNQNVCYLKYDFLRRNLFLFVSFIWKCRICGYFLCWIGVATCDFHLLSELVKTASYIFILAWISLLEGFSFERLRNSLSPPDLFI